MTAQAHPPTITAKGGTYLFFFHEFLAKLDLDLGRTRLLRHDNRGLAAWRSGGLQKFGCFASFQRRDPSPYAGAQTACHFVPGPTLADGDATGLFIGITSILDRWDWDGGRLPAIQDPEIVEGEGGQQELHAFDLQWLEEGVRHSERILIRWGPPAAARAWSQWADRQPKEILELRIDRREPPFPGFSLFMSRISEVPLLPQAWQAALASVRGIYLLVSDDGEQYVGSASGQDGLIGRWIVYAANGHGGNVLLRQRGHRDYAVSILEVASPDMSREDILAREGHWKDKLGARAHGLNRN
ncbi:GIY-YIG nuclease family protein [Rubellimicrobium roseum]|uniref:GIY-YIG nuclease family protein n=1 Tax=Rubellimicrobium roseum TaxID=687525 RepID=A0A5C4N5W6_9RHOB|nr:GIY-YIG nuclease family protein [Rubellimicrobium roseum]TNC59239.1 GIY-YIG nuclease family protein [Rubellimicrobium roseum]